MAESLKLVVTSCVGCPMAHTSDLYQTRCGHPDSKMKPFSYRNDIPSGCPLRKLTITLQLEAD